MIIIIIICCKNTEYLSVRRKATNKMFICPKIVTLIWTKLNQYLCKRTVHAPDPLSSRIQS